MKAKRGQHSPGRRYVSPSAYCALALLFFLVAGTAIALIMQTRPSLVASVINQKEIRFALFLSLATSLCSLCLAVVIGLLASWAIVSGNLPLRPVINIILDLPAVMPPLAAGIGLLLLFGKQGIFGTINPNLTVWLFSPLGLIIAQTYIALSIFTRSAVSAFMSIDGNYIDAACNLGLTPAKAFFLVEIPLVWKPLLGGCILAFSRAIGEFGACLMLAGATRMKTETLPMAIFLNIASGDFNAAVVCAIILMAIAVLMLIILHLAQHGTARHA
jgi:molybdate transport system permease protein